MAPSSGHLTSPFARQVYTPVLERILGCHIMVSPLAVVYKK